MTNSLDALARTIQDLADAGGGGPWTWTVDSDPTDDTTTLLEETWRDIDAGLLS